MARTGRSNIVQALEDGTFFVEDETPTGSINGSNKTFTLANTPAPVSSLEVRINGQVLVLTADYSLSGDTLTTIVAFPTGSALRVDYRVTPA